MSQVNPNPDSDDCCESLSRLIDGELDEHACRRLFARVAEDGDARRAWVRLNVACDAVRSSETAALHSGAFVARLREALDAEPVVLAPGAMRRRYVVLRRVGLPAAAVAAAAVVLTVVALPQLRGDAGRPEIARNTAPATPREVPVPASTLAHPDALEALLNAHRESAVGVVSSRAAEFGVVPAALEQPVAPR